MSERLTPWQKIMRAAKRGTGLRLTADEVWDLGRDSAIETKAGNDDEGIPEIRDEAPRHD